jgi:hypothetical protein
MTEEFTLDMSQFAAAKRGKEETQTSTAPASFDISDLESELEQAPAPVTKRAPARVVEEEYEEYVEDVAEEVTDEGDVSDEDEDTESRFEDVATVTEPKEELSKGREVKRIKSLIGKLKAKDNEFASKEAQYLNAIEALKSQLSGRDSDLATVSKDQAEHRLSQAKLRLRHAKESMDFDAEMEASAELAEAIADKKKAEEVYSRAPKKNAQELEEPIQYSPIQVQGLYKTDAWKRENMQVLQANPDLIQFVEKVAKGIEQEGYIPSDDSYYTEVNRRVNARLKQLNTTIRLKDIYVGDDEDLISGDDEGNALRGLFDEAPVAKKVVKKKIVSPDAPSVQAPPPKKASYAAGTTGDANKVRLSAEEVSFARSMGLDPKHLLEQKRYNAQSGYKNTSNSAFVYIPKKK